MTCALRICTAITVMVSFNYTLPTFIAYGFGKED